MTFQRVINETGLTRTELARLYGVSRQTIHQWTVAAGPREGGHTARMGEGVTHAVRTAVKRRIRPRPGLDKQTRRGKVAVMAKTLQGLKPAPMKG